MCANAKTFPIRLREMLNRVDFILKLQYNPAPDAIRTIAREMKILVKLMGLIALSLYMYERERLILHGIITILTKVEIIVMLTDSAKSLLNRDEHQFEYPPPGDAVSTIRVTPL